MIAASVEADRSIALSKRFCCPIVSVTPTAYGAEINVTVKYPTAREVSYPSVCAGAVMGRGLCFALVTDQGDK